MSPINFRMYVPGLILAVAMGMVAMNGFSTPADGYKVKQVKVVENFFSQQDIDQIFENQKLPKVSSWKHSMSAETNYNGSYMTKEQINRFLEASGEAVGATKDSGHYIMLKKMTSTTGYHSDQSIMPDGSLEPPEDKAAFIFLNSNPKAKFVVDGEEPVPVRAGDLVIFPGGQVHHQTVVDDGYVQIAGPFTTSPDMFAVLGGDKGRKLQVTLFLTGPCPFLLGPRNFIENIIFFIFRSLGFITDEAISACASTPPPAPTRRKLADSWLRHGMLKENYGGAQGEVTLEG